MREDAKTWTFAGSLSVGKAIFYSPDGDLAIEQDHSRLVEPTEDERAEVLKRFPHLRAVVKTDQDTQQTHQPAFSTSLNPIMQAVGREFLRQFSVMEKDHAPKGERTLSLVNTRAAGL